MARTIKPSHYPDIRSRYEGGESMLSISRVYNKDHSVIIYHLKKMGAWRPHAEMPARIHLLPKIRKVRIRKLCIVEGCPSPYQARGLCNNHYVMWRRRGTTVAMPPKIDAERPAPIPCDHKSPRCECLNPGKADYMAYVKKADYRTAKVIHSAW